MDTKLEEDGYHTFYGIAAVASSVPELRAMLL